MTTSVFPHQWMTRQFHTMSKSDIALIAGRFPDSYLRSHPLDERCEDSSGAIREALQAQSIYPYHCTSDALYYEHCRQWAELLKSVGAEWDYTQNQDLLAPYFPILSEDGQTVSIFCSLPDFLRDKRTDIKLGKFIRRLADAPDHTVEELVSTIRSTLAATFSLAVTAEEIKTVYLNGPYSCMAGDGVTQTWKHSEYHPTEIYCYPHDRKTIGCQDDNGIYVAYLGPLDAPQARAVVRHFPDGSKCFNTTYGYSLLRKLLRKAGYNSYHDMLDGAKLTRIGDESEGFLCPYLDGYSGVDDRGEYLVAGEDYSCTTEGWTESPHTERCENCGDRVDEYDATYIEDVGYMCQDCLDRHYTYARIRRGRWGWEEEYIPNSDVVTMTDTGNAYSFGCAQDECHYCEDCDDWYEDGDNMTCTDDGELLCESCADARETERVRQEEFDKVYCNAIVDYHGDGEYKTQRMCKDECALTDIGWVKDCWFAMMRTGATRITVEDRTPSECQLALAF